MKLRTAYKKHFEVWLSDAVLRDNPSIDHAIAIVMNHLIPLSADPSAVTPEHFVKAMSVIGNHYPKLLPSLRYVTHLNLPQHRKVTEYLQHIISTYKNIRRNGIKYENIVHYLLTPGAV